MTETTTAEPVPQVARAQILENPGAVLDDPEVMAALIAADDGLRGENVIDLRGLAIARLEERLNRLEATHQTVLSAAYENVATTSQVHRAILRMIEPLNLAAFLTCLSTDVADILRVASVRILIEADTPPVQHPTMLPVGAGTAVAYMDTWASGRRSDIVLRRTVSGAQSPYDESLGPIRSEALIRLDLGDHLPAAVLALGSLSSDQYAPSHATDLLELFGRVCERVLRELMP